MVDAKYQPLNAFRPHYEKYRHYDPAWLNDPNLVLYDGDPSNGT